MCSESARSFPARRQHRSFPIETASTKVFSWRRHRMVSERVSPFLALECCELTGMTCPPILRRQDSAAVRGPGPRHATNMAWTFQC